MSCIVSFALFSLQNEGSGKPTGAIIGFWVGVVLVVSGISLLLLKQKPEPSALAVARRIQELLLIDVKAAHSEGRAQRPRYQRQKQRGWRRWSGLLVITAE